MSAPCLCGHLMHFGRVCGEGECDCPRASPDYVAGAVAAGEVLTDVRRAKLKIASSDLAAQLGYRGPQRAGVTLDENLQTHACRYCLGEFAGREHAKTCCGACRQAFSKALAYEDDDDVPLASQRRETYSPERERATGRGRMSAQECYEADMRVRATYDTSVSERYVATALS